MFRLRALTMLVCDSPRKPADPVVPPTPARIVLSYKYRLKPTGAQERALIFALDEQRRLYNRFLTDLREGWACYRRLRDAADNTQDPVLLMRADSCGAQYREETSAFGMTKTLTLMREAHPDRYGALPAHMGRWTLSRLAEAQSAFIRRAMAKGGKAGPPRYRSESRWRSFGFKQFMGVQLVADREEIEDVRRQRREARDAAKVGVGHRTVGLPDSTEVHDRPRGKRRSGHSEMYLGWGGMPGALRVSMHRPLPPGHELLSMTVTRDSKGWSCTLQLSVEAEVLQAGHAAREAAKPPGRRVVRTEEPVGLDWGLLRLLTASDGTCFENPRLFRRMRHRIAELSRALSRCKRGSKRRGKVKRELRACWEHLRDMRLTHAHQTSAHLAARYLLIALEDLSVRNMTASARGTVEEPGSNVRQKAGLNREILDTAPRMRINLVTYKAERAGGRVRLVDPAGTSQRCHRCRAVVAKALSERRHRCEPCGIDMDRDLNSSMLIRDLGFPPEPDFLPGRWQAA